MDDSPDESTNGATAAGKRSAGVTAFELRSPDRRVRIEAVVADATVYLHDANPDLVVGCAFLDLLEPSGVDALLEAIPKGCVCYFPITFDGGTWFGPETDDADGFDELVAERYHEDMRRRRDPGDPHAGRRLLSRASTDHDLVAAGASDWIVTPVDDGAGDDGCGNGDSDGGGDWYPADEAYFLHYIVDTVSGALADDPAVDDDRLAAWADRRHAAIDAGALVYVAHQLDVALRV